MPEQGEQESAQDRSIGQKAVYRAAFMWDRKP